jgi:hypothetical protein
MQLKLLLLQNLTTETGTSGLISTSSCRWTWKKGGGKELPKDNQ